MPRHVDATVQPEGHAFAFEQAALAVGVVDTEIRAQGSPLLDHPMAGDLGPMRISVHGPADDPG